MTAWPSPSQPFQFICFLLSGLPVVRFCSKKEMALKPERWIVKTGAGALLSRKQIPLRLAWAFSIHKSQVVHFTLLEAAHVSVTHQTKLGIISVMD